MTSERIEEAPAASRDEGVRAAVDGLLRAYGMGDPDLGENCAHLPYTEVIEWKGLANIWNASSLEFRQTVEARKEEPLTQETVEEAIEWLSDLTALVFRKVKTNVSSGKSFVSPALFLVVPDREGRFKVVVSWWGAFPDWFQG